MNNTVAANENVVKVYSYEGNVRDGFDNNNICYLSSETFPEGKEITEKQLLKVARDYFEGRYLARTENQSLPMVRSKIQIDVLDEFLFGVTYMDQPVGELRLGLFSARTCEACDSMATRVFHGHNYCLDCFKESESLDDEK